MYMAKGGGKGRYQLFDAQMHDNMVDRSALKTDLAVAVAAGQLRLDYQPVADLRTGEVLGVEALVRWQHPTLGLLAPADFITLAEETGDIDAIGCWVLDTATRQVAALAPNHRPLRRPLGLGQPLRVPAPQRPQPGRHPAHPGRPGRRKPTTSSSRSPKPPWPPTSTAASPPSTH